MMRSSNILLYGFDSLTPYEVRSTNDGRMYRLWISRMLGGRLRSVMVNSSVAGTGTGRNLPCPGHNMVDEAVILGLFRGEPAVPVRVGLDLLRRLPGVEGHALLE